MPSPLPTPTPPTVPRSTFAFKTDVAPSERDSHPSGVIHAVKIERGGRPRREEHAFAWIDDRRRAGAVDGVLRHLERFGFDGNRALFVPYSSREGWVHCYPHACPYIKCDADGTIRGIPSFSQCTNDGDSGPRPTKRRKRGRSSGARGPRPRMFPSALLSDEERSRLHVEIYEYFRWLSAELAEAERTHAGRSRARRAGVSAPGLRNLVSKLEGTFRCVGELKKEREEKEKGNVDDGGGEGGDAGNDASGGTDDANTGGDGAAEDEKENNEPSVRQLPLLETSMGGYLKDILEESQANDDDSRAAPLPPSKPRDFDAMFEHLLAYRERTGDLLVPHRYVHADGTPDRVCLGGWVGDLRRSRRVLRARGLECEPENNLTELTMPTKGGRIGLSLAFSDSHLPGARIVSIQPSCPFGDRIRVGDRLLRIDGSDVTKREDLERGREKESRVFGISPGRVFSSAFLTADRLARLDAIGFVWEGKKTPPRPWEERLAQVKQFKATHGKWPNQVEKWEGIGNWVKEQRRSYSQRDERFMAERYPRLEEIGFPFGFRRSGTSAWDDHFQQLVEFHRVNRHFNVPLPENSGEDGEGVSEELRFYRWVVSLHSEHAHYQNGRRGQGTLNKDRVRQLLELGFQFDNSRIEDGNKSAIPDVPFGRRLEQLRKCRQELGHFKIDNRYTKMDNIGGWAYEISKRHKDWREGKAEISPLEEDQFRQLSDMGFQFDVFAEVRTKRSWQENLDAFLAFKAKYGHPNVPYHYKGDMRLGTWVQVQRKEYKLHLEEKPSKLTQEKIDTLENVGFVWRCPRD